MEQLVQRTITMKTLLGIGALFIAIGALLGAALQSNRQAAAATKKLAAERARAAQIDRDDKAMVEEIRKQNRQKANAASQK
jgi:hypothetical protein